MEAYRKLVLSTGKSKSGTKKAANTAVNSKHEQRRQSSGKRTDSGSIRAQISKKEKQIQKLEEAIRKLDSSLATPGIFRTHPEKATKFTKQRGEAEKLLTRVEEEWLKLGEQLEAAR